MSADMISSRAMQWASKVQSIADQARDLTLEAAQSVGARYADETKAADIGKLLDGRTDREKIDGMRRTIALSSKGVDMSAHFAMVVKNVASSNLEIRKLVYIYITRYAESQPDLALLSINTIQKALSDQNQIVRALALRVISSIRVVSISGIVLLSIKKCMTDSSFYVRKTAAMAITKTNALDSSLHRQLVDCLKTLLSDSHPSVLSSAIESCNAVCPDPIGLLHPVYRRACDLLGQMDEFGQVNVLKILERYARQCFTDPAAGQNAIQEQDFYEAAGTSRSSNTDLSLLLKSATALLRSRNSAVVLAACRLLWTLGTKSDAKKIVSSLLALLRNDDDVKFVVLANIVGLALHDPTIWHEAAHHFVIYPTDPDYIWKLKLEMITLIINPDNTKLLLSELSQYASDTTDEIFSRAAIQAICKAAQHAPEVSQSCLDILVGNLSADSPSLVGESVLAIRQLVQLNPTGHLRTIKVLAKTLKTIEAASARASIYWLVSENLHHLSRVAPDVLRLGVKAFATEDVEVRTQILTLGVKMYVLHCQHMTEEDASDINGAIQDVETAQTQSEAGTEVHRSNGHDLVKENMESNPQAVALDILPETESPIPKLYAYLTHLARYDTSYDLRDRLRTYKILASSPNWILTKKLLFVDNPLPNFISASAGKEMYAIGSSSLLIGISLPDYEDLPPWATTVIGTEERNVITKAPVLKNLQQNISLPQSRSVTPVVLGQEVLITKPTSKLTGISSLDDFYATSSEEEESSDADTLDEEEDGEEEEGTGSDESAENESDTDEAESEEISSDEEHGAGVSQELLSASKR